MNNKYKIILLIISFLFSNLLFATENITFSIELKTSKQKAGSSNIAISIKNNSNEDLKLLKWNTPLESTLSANIFDVKQDGKKTIYIGRLVKRGKPTDDDFTLLKAGEVINTTIEIAKYYKMDKKAKYQIGYKGSFSYKENILTKQSKTAKELKLKRVKVIKKSVELDFEPLVKEDEPSKKESTDDEETSQKAPAEFEACTSSEVEILNNAHDAAINLTLTASEDMNNAPIPTSFARYVEWFGAPNTDRHNIIKNNFSTILNALDTQNIAFNCGCDDNAYAYVYPTKHYEIYLCNAFWGASLTGTDSQAGTIIHETSHFVVVADTDDHVYGQPGARDLADSDPDKAVNNADSHEYFAENTPFLSMTDEVTPPDAYHILLVAGFNIEGSIDTGDETDFYTFRVPSHGTLTVYTTGSLDTVGNLYDAKISQLAYNDDTTGDNTSGYNFEFTKKINSGTHFISVDSFGTNTGNYTLYIDFIPAFNNAPIINYLLN